MFNFRNLALALVAVVSMSFAGSASASLLKRDSPSTAATPSSLMIPIPGLATISLGFSGGLQLGVNLFPSLPGFTPIVDLSLLGGRIGVVAFAGAVPEPETYAMMGLGLGLVALVTRRRRKAATTAPIAA